MKLNKLYKNIKCFVLAQSLGTLTAQYTETIKL